MTSINDTNTYDNTLIVCNDTNTYDMRIPIISTDGINIHRACVYNVYIRTPYVCMSYTVCADLCRFARHNSITHVFVSI